jgi:hypothetical protein
MTRLDQISGGIFERESIFLVCILETLIRDSSYVFTCQQRQLPKCVVPSKLGYLRTRLTKLGLRTPQREYGSCLVSTFLLAN